MRATCEIIADVKDGKEVQYEELMMACLVQSFLLFQYQNDVKNLIKGGISAELTLSSKYSDVKTSSKEGGISSIIITDNGCGIDKDNMRLAFLPHATSKLSKAEDLDNIATLGFRGEALASVAAVAQVTMTSKTKDDEVGNYITLSAGKVVEEGKRAISQSTSIAVENLFFNTPVRKKFLKKPKQEEALVSAIMTQLALANPDIKFKYTADGKVGLSNQRRFRRSRLCGVRK